MRGPCSARVWGEGEGERGEAPSSTLSLLPSLFPAPVPVFSSTSLPPGSHSRPEAEVRARATGPVCPSPLPSILAHPSTQPSSASGEQRQAVEQGSSSREAGHDLRGLDLELDRLASRESWYLNGVSHPGSRCIHLPTPTYLSTQLLTHINSLTPKPATVHTPFTYTHSRPRPGTHYKPT